MIVTYNTANVVCGTSGCANNGMSLAVLIEQTSPKVGCGVCTNPITDITVTGTETRDE